VRLNLNNSTIRSEPLNFEINTFIKALFKDIGLDKILEENVWIAGGFPRLLGKCHFNMSERHHRRVIRDYLYYESGDIDIFSSSQKILDICKKRIESCAPLHQSYKLQRAAYTNTFSEGFYFHSEDYTHNPGGNAIKIQLVNKFFYNEIAACLNSFDFTNCKFAIEFKNDSFFIHYDEEAVKYEKEGKLNLEHCKSPLFARRIIKYIANKGLELYNSNRNNRILREYYYNVITKNWDKVFIDNMADTDFALETLGIKKLEKWIDIPREDLILFINKMDMPMYKENNTSAGYGSYYSLIGTSDWATKILSGN
jgi:hypothetical protein